MYIRIGIWMLNFLIPVAALAQQQAVLNLAQRVGLCDNGHASQQPDLGQPDCAECDLFLIPLQGAMPNPDCFFLECQSAAHCGTGGCTGTVYEKTKQGYQARLRLFGVVDQKLSQPSSEPPIIVYTHHTNSYDFNGNSSPEPASVWAAYEWDDSRKRLLLLDILKIRKQDGSPVPIEPWRSRLLKEWRRDSPWVF